MTRTVDCLLNIKKSTIIRTHRCIISAFSPVLYDLIRAIGSKAAITLQIENDAFFITTQDAGVVVNFMYTGELNNLKKVQLESLLSAAEKLKFDNLRRLIILMLYQMKEEKERREREAKSRGISEERMIEMDMFNEYKAIYEDFVSGPLKRKKCPMTDRKPKKITPLVGRDNSDDEGSKSDCNVEKVAQSEFDRSVAVMSEKPFKCHYCEHRSKTKEAMKKHVRSIHSLETPYICAICGLGFKVQSNFARHQRSHSGEKPYKCMKCGMEYADKKNIDRHVFQEHFNARELKCSFSGCKSKFWRQDRYLVHFKKKHGGVPENLFFT